MEVLALLLSALSLLPGPSLGFNLALDHPFLAVGPFDADPSSYFGYSLALDESTLYVGAPGHDVSGAVFKCPISSIREGREEAQCDKIETRGELRSSIGRKIELRMTLLVLSIF